MGDAGGVQGPKSGVVGTGRGEPLAGGAMAKRRLCPAPGGVGRSQLDKGGGLGQIGAMADEQARRLQKLELNFAHLEHQFEQLNGVVIEQSKLLERLKREVQRQSNAMETMELDRIKSNITKPPHYQ